jgi:hypothetical protein
VLAEDHVLRDVAPGPFDLVTAIEVFEHETAPHALMRRLAALVGENGILLVSTELHDPAVHGKDWWYLAPEHGQHVMFATRSGFRAAGEQAGLRWVMSFEWEGRDFLHMLVPAGRRVQPFKTWRLRRRHVAGEERFPFDRYV